MGLKDKLTDEVKTIFADKWEVQGTNGIPDPADLRLNANSAKDLDAATVLYADLDGSTNMVDTKPWSFSAEVYKAYLRCAAQIIRDQGGVITAYDGDRVMAIFTGKCKNTDAVKSALMINYAVANIIQPAIIHQYTTTDFLLRHVIGIDSSQLRAARIGIHGDNDIVWIGRAANYAAKLCALSSKPIWITRSVYDVMHSSVKLSNGKEMWSRHTWTAMNNAEVFATTYHWSF